MELNYLMNYSVPVIVGICLCVGYVIKNSLPFIPNKYIPLLMAVLGLIVNSAAQQNLSAEIALQGMFSGLLSTGMFELLRNLVNKD